MSAKSSQLHPVPISHPRRKQAFPLVHLAEMVVCGFTVLGGKDMFLSLEVMDVKDLQGHLQLSN